jgi:tripartite motif-containing protein 71
MLDSAPAPASRPRSLPRPTAATASLVVLLGLSLVGSGAQTAEAGTSVPPFVTMWGSAGSADGQFSFAHHLAATSDGRIYVGDLLNDRVQEFNSTGTFLRKWTVRGADGIAIAPNGTIYVVGSDTVWKYTDTGTLLGHWGSPGSGPGQFNAPVDVAVDADSNVYVAEAGNHRVQKFDAAGGFIRQWGSQGNGDSQFQFPLGIAIGPDGYVYVADVQTSRIQRFTAEGVFVSGWGTAGTDPGQLGGPGRPFLDSAGRVLVPEGSNNRISLLMADGTYLFSWGQAGVAPGQFNSPTCVSEDGDGFIYVMDKDNARVQKFGGIPTAVSPTTWGRMKRLYR